MESRLGLLRAAIIVWVSGLVPGAFLSLFFSQMAWALLARSTRQRVSDSRFLHPLVLRDAG